MGYSTKCYEPSQQPRFPHGRTLAERARIVVQVWIYQERLHLVPIEHVSALPFPSTATGDSPEEGFIDALAAVDLVRNSTVDTLAPLDLEAIVMARIEGCVNLKFSESVLNSGVDSLRMSLTICTDVRYPKRMDDHHHKTLSYLPVEIALALQQSPSLIAEAIAAFYEREPVSLRVRQLSVRIVKD